MKAVKVTKSTATLLLTLKELLIISGALGVSVVQHELLGKPKIDGYKEEVRVMRRIDGVIRQIGIKQGADS